MSNVFKKMNLKPDVSQIVVLDAPPSFEPELAALSDVTVIRDPAAVTAVTYGLAFVITQAELDAAGALLTARAQGDALLWFAYPKKSSKRYTCEFDRDTGWDKLGEAGFEPVRQVAIDADWSALRFRHVSFIKSMKRDSQWALSAEGKRRTSSNE